MKAPSRQSHNVPQKNQKGKRSNYVHKGKRTNWTSEEDSLLRAQVDIHGTNSWHQVAKSVGSRDAKQCYQRWTISLSRPEVHRSWTKAEDKIIRDYFRTHGSRWTFIAKQLEARSALSVKNRLRTLKRYHHLKGPSSNAVPRYMRKAESDGDDDDDEDSSSQSAEGDDDDEGDVEEDEEGTEGVEGGRRDGPSLRSMAARMRGQMEIDDGPYRIKSSNSSSSGAAGQGSPSSTLPTTLSYSGLGSELASLTSTPEEKAGERRSQRVAGQKRGREEQHSIVYMETPTPPPTILSSLTHRPSSQPSHLTPPRHKDTSAMPGAQTYLTPTPYPYAYPHQPYPHQPSHPQLHHYLQQQKQQSPLPPPFGRDLPQKRDVAQLPSAGQEINQPGDMRTKTQMSEHLLDPSRSIPVVAPSPLPRLASGSHTRESTGHPHVTPGLDMEPVDRSGIVGSITRSSAAAAAAVAGHRALTQRQQQQQQQQQQHVHHPPHQQYYLRHQQPYQHQPSHQHHHQPQQAQQESRRQPQERRGPSRSAWQIPSYLVGQTTVPIHMGAGVPFFGTQQKR